MDVCIIDAIIQTSMNNAIKYVQQYDDIHKCKAVVSAHQPRRAQLHRVADCQI